MKYVKTYESFHGELITKSQYHSVYQDSKNRDRVIKAGDAAIEHGKLFQKFPGWAACHSFRLALSLGPNAS